MPTNDWNQIDSLWQEIQKLTEIIDRTDNAVERAKHIKIREQKFKILKEESAKLQQIARNNIISTLNKMLELVKKIENSKDPELTNHLCQEIQQLFRANSWLQNLDLSIWSRIWKKCGFE